jgi:hypothetical protein
MTLKGKVALAVVAHTKAIKYVYESIADSGWDDATKARVAANATEQICSYAKRLEAMVKEGKTAEEIDASFMFKKKPASRVTFEDDFDEVL